MKILLVIAEMARGGAEQMVLLLADGLVARAHEAVLAAAPGPLDAEVAAVGIGRHNLRPPSRAPVPVASSLAHLAWVIRRTRPDVVHAHNVRIGGMTAIAARLAAPRSPTPVLVTLHGVAPREYRAAARILRLADHVTAVSMDTATCLEEAGLRRDRLTVVRNAVKVAPPSDRSVLERLDAELGLTQAPLVVIVGRLVAVKAHVRFLTAVERVQRVHPEIRYLIVGDGPLRQMLEERARQLGVAKVVRFTGLRSDVPAIISRADLMVFSSDSEGLSIAALEALAAGVPVVSTPVEGMNELLGRGAGIVVDSHDAGALARGILAGLEDPAGRAAMGAAGRRLVAEEFSPGTMLRDYEALYRRLTQPEASTDAR